MSEAKTMLEKLAAAAPYNILYNKVPGLPEKEASNSVIFRDFLCPSLGKLKNSLHIMPRINVDADINWFIEEYKAMDVGTTPMTILYGKSEDRFSGVLVEESGFPNVTLKCVLDPEIVKKNYKYSNHHEKMSIFLYEDNSLRILIPTSNIRNDWDHFNYGFWMSPLCRPLHGSASGESPTNFKSDLLHFLNHYKLPVLDEWIDYIKNVDFGDVKVFLITSITGRYPPERFGCHLQQMQDLLKKHCHLPPGEEHSWPVIAQSSLLATFGESPDVWLRSFFMKHLASPEAQLKIIFPTRTQLMTGYWKRSVSGTGIRYFQYTHDSQPWIQDYLYQWKADVRGRTKIMPHTQTYCRVSPCWTKMAWFLLTNCNLNKSGWGQKFYTRDDVFVKNSEIGVLFLPKFFDEEYFQVDNFGEKIFPVIYDLPLEKYAETDQPFMCDAKGQN